MKKQSVDVLDEADRQSRILDWVLFKNEQANLLRHIEGSLWNVGDPIWNHPVAWNPFNENNNSQYVRPMVEEVQEHRFHNRDEIDPFELNACYDCEVYSVGEDTCWMCGQRIEDFMSKVLQNDPLEDVRPNEWATMADIHFDLETLNFEALNAAYDQMMVRVSVAVDGFQAQVRNAMISVNEFRIRMGLPEVPPERGRPIFFTTNRPPEIEFPEDLNMELEIPLPEPIFPPFTSLEENSWTRFTRPDSRTT